MGLSVSYISNCGFQGRIGSEKLTYSSIEMFCSVLYIENVLIGLYLAPSFGLGEHRKVKDFWILK